MTDLLKKPESFWTCYNSLNFLIPFITIVYSYPFDLPMNLSSELREFKGVSDQHIVGLYSAYSLPNLGMSILFGIVLQKWGPRLMFLIFALCFIGQCLFSLGVSLNVIWLMYVGRVVYGSGAESASVGLWFVIKMYIPEENIIVIGCLSIIMSRTFMSLAALLGPGLFHATGSFTATMVLACIMILLATLLFWVYLATQERRAKSHPATTAPKPQPFKCKDVKNLSTRFYILTILNCTTYGVYWTFQPMIRQVLEQAYTLTPTQTTNMVVLIPMIQMAAIFACMFAAKFAQNESWFIFASALLCLGLMIFVPVFQTTNIVFAYLVIVAHAIYGAVFISTYSTCLAKAVPLE
jgi:MFS family permease